MKLSSGPKTTEGRKDGDQHVRLPQGVGAVLALALGAQVGAGAVGLAGVQGAHVQQAADVGAFARLDDVLHQFHVGMAEGHVRGSR